MCDVFLSMVDAGAEVHDFGHTIIVLEDHGLTGYKRGWLLFDKFSKKTVSAIKKVSEEFKGKALYASTHDARIRDLLLKFGYVQYAQDEHDCYLKRINHGM